MRGNRKIRKSVTNRKSAGKGFVRRLKMALLIAVPAVVAIAFIYFISITIRLAFQISEIVITGNEHLSEGEIRDLAVIKGDENLLMIRSGRLSEKLTGSPWIRSVSIRKDFPHRLCIHVNEAEPFALLDIKGRFYILDEKGKMLEELKDNSVPFLPIISGMPFGNKEILSEALILAKSIKKNGLLSENDHIEIIANKLQDIAVNVDGVVVRVGSGDYDDKLQRLAQLKDEIKNRNIHIDYIDLRFMDRAVVKPVNEVYR